MGIKEKQTYFLENLLFILNTIKNTKQKIAIEIPFEEITFKIENTPENNSTYQLYDQVIELHMHDPNIIVTPEIRAYEKAKKEGKLDKDLMKLINKYLTLKLDENPDYIIIAEPNLPEYSQHHQLPAYTTEDNIKSGQSLLEKNQESLSYNDLNEEDLVSTGSQPPAYTTRNHINFNDNAEEPPAYTTNQDVKQQF